MLQHCILGTLRTLKLEKAAIQLRISINMFQLTFQNMLSVTRFTSAQRGYNLKYIFINKNILFYLGIIAYSFQYNTEFFEV